LGYSSHLRRLRPPTAHVHAGTGDDDGASLGAPSPDPLRGSGSGLLVLLVEDQTIIALDTELMLAELGAARVQSFTSAIAALEWLSAAQADVAVLDIALGSATSYPVADALADRGIPFVFTTGYGESHLVPPRFSKVPIVQKPYGVESLSEGLTRCLARRA
jgi:CheY-like chemotaxis protein